MRLPSQMLQAGAPLLASAVLLIAVPARAQIVVQPQQPEPPPITIDPGGGGSGGGGDDYGGGDNSGAATNPNPGAAAGQGGDAVEEGYYHYDDLGLVDASEDDGLRSSAGVQGPVPELHVVRKGDTLWDICALYFNNPYEWPRIWSYNPSITNPHWIYPGDVVRLHPMGAQTEVADSTVSDPIPNQIDTRPAPTKPIGAFGLRQLAFVERGELERALTIVGSERERDLLSTGDVIYLSYPKGSPPQVGRTYSVYSPTKRVYHPSSSDKKKQRVVGAYVRVLGDIEILSVRKGKRARAVIRRSNQVIERGQRVGKVSQTFREVKPVPAQADVTGMIVDIIAGSELVGTQQLVFLDVGASDGVRVGNRMFVARAGDARPLETSLREAGRDDLRFPQYAIAELLVVDTGKSTSVAMVTKAIQEAEVGERVILRRAR